MRQDNSNNVMKNMKTIENLLGQKQCLGPYIINESAVEYEHEIARAFRGDIDTKNPKIYNASVNIVNQLKKLPNAPRGDNAIQLGASSLPLTQEWKKWGGKDTTPKTDIILGNHKVSLKIGKASQLMSGGKGDATATIMSILVRHPGTEEIQRQAIELFDGFVKRAVTKEKGTTAELLKTGKDENVVLLNELHLKATNLFNSYFETNQDIYVDVVQEAMAGEIKFGGNDGTADHILAASKDGKKVIYHSTYDRNYVSKVAKQANIRVKFKTDSQKIKGKKTGYTVYRSAFGLLLNKMVEAKSLGYRKNVLHENIKSKIDNYLKRGIENVIDFYALKIDVLFNNDVNFLV